MPVNSPPACQVGWYRPGWLPRAGMTSRVHHPGLATSYQQGLRARLSPLTALSESSQSRLQGNPASFSEHAQRSRCPLVCVGQGRGRGAEEAQAEVRNR